MDHSRSGDGRGGAVDASSVPVRACNFQLERAFDGGRALCTDWIAGHHALLPPQPCPPELQAPQVARVHLRLLGGAGTPGI